MRGIAPPRARDTSRRALPPALSLASAALQNPPLRHIRTRFLCLSGAASVRRHAQVPELAETCPAVGYPKRLPSLPPVLALRIPTRKFCDPAFFFSGGGEGELRAQKFWRVESPSRFFESASSVTCGGPGTHQPTPVRVTQAGGAWPEPKVDGLGVLPPLLPRHSGFILAER